LAVAQVPGDISPTDDPDEIVTIDDRHPPQRSLLTLENRERFDALSGRQPVG